MLLQKAATPLQYASAGDSPPTTYTYTYSLHSAMLQLKLRTLARDRNQTEKPDRAAVAVDGLSFSARDSMPVIFCSIFKFSEKSAQFSN